MQHGTSRDGIRWLRWPGRAAEWFNGVGSRIECEGQQTELHLTEGRMLLATFEGYWYPLVMFESETDESGQPRAVSKW